MKIFDLAQTLLRRNSWFVAAFQAALIVCSLILTWFLTFDFTLPHRRLFFLSACILILVRMVMIAGFGLLHGWWRYTGISDTLDVAKSVLLGSVLFIAIIHFGLNTPSFPRTVYVLEPVLTTGLLIGVRIFSRVLAESVRQDLVASRKVLLIGAGIGAQTVVREIGRAGSEYAPIGYVDDDQSKQGLKVEDLPVLGTVDQLPQVIESHLVDEVLIAVPSATSKQMQRFVEICERTGVKCRTVPALRDVIAQRVSISDFRDIDVEDLLGRDPVEIDLQSVRGAIHGHSVLVTGAAGSIGSELCRQILEHEPSFLTCVDQSETGMFYLDRELQPRKRKSKLRCHIADTGDRAQMEHILQQSKTEVIFHAAAYKHVPLMEENIPAAVRNNIFGLMNLLEVASENGCRAFVLISSDKAVNPSNVMGATKRVGELIIAHQPTNGMRCLSVRFGNVLGSNGSVIPVLQRQLHNHEPLTVTHPEIRRFFMTIREAVSLVLQASVIGEKGDTLVLDMGQPLLILDLVRTLIKLSGKDEKQVEIRFTGLRKGEKLVEELVYADEAVDPTSFPKIKRVHGPMRDWDLLLTRLESLEAALSLNQPDAIRAQLAEILPEYSYSPDNAPEANGDEASWPPVARRSVA